ncbi:phosphate/phosphite/phosphonate ABC transporter substrate-binding protein [Escherichia coli]|uniref:phosphate/phosphite/phosphonate ABC transporter substrate-binding protein n=1 Tax=Escherichia coli TaxID=562 RepID=UPI000F5C96E8|nr:phosphate/phosphite/phosphonate ABC transporter substrate-binding protein [Escherichia coli]RQW53930.1 phosphate/phosphite/phosphonate ABC transporter substrate-binding protein [Escherichia coli]
MNAKIIASLAFTSMFSLSTLLSPAHAEEQEKALNFGIISTESQQNLKPQWTPFLQDMEKKLGVKVNAFFAPDYAGIIQGMRFNKVDIAWYGNLSAMEAVDRANGQVFAQTVAADGSPGYWSVLIVNKDSPINNLNDLLAKRKDLTFGNGDPNSTSGFLVPGYYVFAKNNISASDFKRTVNAGHETNALAVANKLEEILYGVLPQVMPLLISYSLYRFESNVRSATVVGMVGAGGIGVTLWEAIRGFQFQQTCALMVLIIVTVSLLDFLSQRLRKHFI